MRMVKGKEEELLVFDEPVMRRGRYMELPVRVAIFMNVICVVMGIIIKMLVDSVWSFHL